MHEPTELITIGKIERPFGVKGEVRVRSLSDVPGRFEGLQQVTLVTPTGQSVDASVTRVRRVRGAYIVSLDVLETPEQAAQFRGSWFKIPKELTPPLPQGQYYEFELQGLTVVDETGWVLGTVEEILDTPGNHVFVIRGGDAEHLLPATKDVVRSVDHEERRMTVRWAAAAMGSSDAV